MSTDWYAAFVNWDQASGDNYLAGRDGGSFAWGPSAYVQRMYLNLFRAFNESVWLDKLAGQIDRILASGSDVPPYEIYDPRYVDGYRGWGQNRYRQYKPEYTEWLSDDGLIVSPILAFVELVRDDPYLHAAYKAKADDYLRIVEADVIAKWYANVGLNEAPLDNTRYVDPGAASGSFHYRITAVDYRRPPNEGPPSAAVTTSNSLPCKGP